MPLAREGALAVLTAVANNGGRVAEPYVVPLLDLVLERYADKVTIPNPAFACACMHVLVFVGLLLDHLHTSSFYIIHFCMHILAWGAGQSLCCTV